jgi:hypothetical protein
MNVETGAEAALFPEKEYINGIFVAVQQGFTDNTGCVNLERLLQIYERKKHILVF